MRCDDKNNMIANQSDSIIGEVTVRREPLAYKRSIYREEVQLEFRETSQLFLQALPLQANPRFRPLLRDFPVKFQQKNRISFVRAPQRPSADPLDFIRQVQRILEGFEVLAIRQNYDSQKPLGRLKERILALGDKVGASQMVENVDLGTRQLFVFADKEQVLDMMEVVDRYILAKEERLVFSLSWFIRKEVSSRYWKPFILKLHQFYSRKLQSLQKDRSGHQELNLQILGVSPAYISPDELDGTWFKAERRGIYGLQFVVYGQQHQFIRFYSLVEQFFSNLTYSVHQSSEIRQSHKDLSSKLEGMNLKAAVLSQIIVIFQPPINLQSIIKDLNRKRWVLSPKDFLNLNFQLFHQYKRQYAMKLRSKNGVVFTDIKIESDIVEFQADEHSFKRIKTVSRQFLLDMKRGEVKVDFLQCPQDVEIILKYYSGNMRYDLVWTHNGAVLACPKEYINDTYNAIREKYRKLTKNMVTVVSSRPIIHPLVKGATIPMQFNYFPSRLYKIQDLTISFRSIQEIYKEKRVLFIVNPYDEESEARKIIRRNCDLTKPVQEYDMQQVVTENQLNLQFIYIIKLTGRDNPSIRAERLTKMLEEFITSKLPVRITLPSPSTRSFASLVKMIGDYLVFRCSALTHKEAAIFIPHINMGKHPAERVMRNIRDALLLAGPFVKVCPYSLSQEQILNGNNLKLVRMHYCIKNRNLECTSLNSFVLKCEIESNKENDCKIGIFLPKSQCREYLVFLPTLKILKVIEGQVIITEVNSQMFQTILQFMKKCFPRQTYTVIYYDPQRNGYLTSLYLYKSRSPGKLRKCKVDLSEMTLMQGKDEIPFSLECTREECFLLQTHHLFRKELIALLDKHRRR